MRSDRQSGCYPTSVILALYPAIRGLDRTDRDSCQFSIRHHRRGRSLLSSFTFPRWTRISLPTGLENISICRRSFRYCAGQPGRNFTGVRTACTATAKGDSIDSFLPQSQRCIAGGNLENLPEHIPERTFHPFISIRRAPDLQAIQATNFLDIGLFEDRLTGELIIVSAEDNLVKGASGQAVQCLNLKMGIAEDTGLLTL